MEIWFAAFFRTHPVYVIIWMIILGGIRNNGLVISKIRDKYFGFKSILIPYLNPMLFLRNQLRN
jgi:hypothetical protein